MRVLTALLLITISVGFAARPLANPVDQGTVDRLNSLPAEIVRSPTADAKREFVQLIGRYGFALMDKKAKEQVERNFDQFAPLLAQSQSPGNRVDDKVQDFFWGHADAAQQETMIMALKSWLDAPLKEAPFHGGVRIVGPESAVRGIILQERITAAQTLWVHNHSLGMSMVDAILDSCASRVWQEADPCGELIAWTFQNPGSSSRNHGTIFLEEEVVLTVTATRLEVEGVYAFSRGSSATTSLWFPFPEGSHIDFNGIAVTDPRTESKAAWSWGGNGIVIRLDFGGEETTRVRIRYADKLSENRAVYILKTAALWPQPIGKAHLQVNMPVDYAPSFSLHFVQTQVVDSMATYEFSATEFQPDRDLVVTW